MAKPACRPRAGTEYTARRDGFSDMQSSRKSQGEGRGPDLLEGRRRTGVSTRQSSIFQRKAFARSSFSCMPGRAKGWGGVCCGGCCFLRPPDLPAEVRGRAEDSAQI